MTQKPELQAPGSGENPWEHENAGILKKKKKKRRKPGCVFRYGILLASTGLGEPK